MGSDVRMGQFAIGAQERQLHLSGAVILQLLLVPVAAVKDLQQEMIGGVRRGPAGARSVFQDTRQVVTDLHELGFGNTAHKKDGLERALERLAQEEEDGQIVRSARIGATESHDASVRDGREASGPIDQREGPQIVRRAISERDNASRHVAPIGYLDTHN